MWECDCNRMSEQTNKQADEWMNEWISESKNKRTNIKTKEREIERDVICDATEQCKLYMVAYLYYVLVQLYILCVPFSKI